jgi:hypothetical protein
MSVYFSGFFQQKTGQRPRITVKIMKNHLIKLIFSQLDLTPELWLALKIRLFLLFFIVFFSIFEISNQRIFPAPQHDGGVGWLKD